METDPTAPVHRLPSHGKVTGRLPLHLMPLSPLLTTLAHTELPLPQTCHLPSCLGPFHWLVPLPGTCLPHILTGGALASILQVSAEMSAFRGLS